jgi:DNA replication licensing factor MCM2
MTASQRRAAEAEMARRDRAGGRGRGRRAAARRRAPGFIDDDEEEDLDDEDGGALSGIIPAGVKIRTRKQYDERQDVDDAAGAEDDDEMPFEQLSDIKANSVTEWIAQPRVRKTIEKQFRHFLVTYVDESGTSVYGERIKTLGEGMSRFTLKVPLTSESNAATSQLRILRSILCPSVRV